MSETEMQAELERLRAENAKLKNRTKADKPQGERERSGFSVRHGPLSGHALQGTMLRILAGAPLIEAFIARTKPN